MFAVWCLASAFVATSASAHTPWRPVAVDLVDLEAQQANALLALRRGLRTGAVVVKLGSSATEDDLLSAVSRCIAGHAGLGSADGLTVLDSNFPPQVSAACPDLESVASRHRDLASLVAATSAAVVDASAKELSADNADDIARKSVQGGMVVQRYAISAAPSEGAPRAQPDVGVFMIFSSSSSPTIMLRDGRMVTPEVPRDAVLLLVGDAMRLISSEYRPMPFVPAGPGAFASISFSIHDDFVGLEAVHRQAEALPTDKPTALNDGTALLALSLSARGGSGSMAMVPPTPEEAARGGSGHMVMKGETDTPQEVAPALFCKPGAMTMHMAGFVSIFRGGADDNCINFFFTDWTLSTPLIFALASIASFGMGAAAEGLQSYRRRFKGGTFPKTMLYFLNITLGYAVMLIVMTYSVELAVISMIGLGVGHAAFNINLPVSASHTQCCSLRNPSEDVLANKAYKVEGMMCQACAQTVKGALLGLDFVEVTDVEFKHGLATVYFSKETVSTDGKIDALVIDAVEGVGFGAEVWQGSLPPLTYTPPAVMPLQQA